MMDSTAASDLSPRQQQLAAASASAAIADRADRAARAQMRRDEPAAGDRYVLPVTADFPVEWVLLQRHPELPAFLAVLADTYPLVGSADFAAAAPAGGIALPAGALRLRGGATAWIEESTLDPSLRVGSLDAVTIERARRKLLASPQDPDPEWIGEADASLEYRDWRREVVAPALAALGPQTRFAVPPLPELPALPAERSRFAREERGPRSRSGLWAAAAAVFFALNLALAGYAGWQREEIADLAAANREARQEMERALEGERARQGQVASQASQDLRRRLDAVRLAEAGKRKELERRLASLQSEPESLPRFWLNVPLAYLNPAEVFRSDGGSSPVTHLGAEAPYVAVALNLDSEVEYPSYRVVLKRQGASSPLWQSDELKRRNDKVVVVMDRSLFSPGATYHFDLYGLRGGRAEPLGEYEMPTAP